MADSKVASLTAISSVDGDELLYLVDDPSGIPLDRKVTVDTLLASCAPAVTLAAGKWYANPLDSGNVGDLTLVDQQAVAVPIMLDTAGTATGIAIDVHGTSGAGGKIRLGLYSDTNGLPGILLVDGGQVDADGAVGALAVTISQAVPRGLTWIVVCEQGAPAGDATTGAAMSFPGVKPLALTALADLAAGTSSIAILKNSFAVGVFPASFGAPTGVGFAVHCAVKL